MKLRHRFAIITVLVLLVIVTFTGTICFASFPKNVELEFQTSNCKEQPTIKTVETKTQSTVRDLLVKEGYDLESDKFYVNVGLNEKVREVDSIKIQEKIGGCIIVDGKTIKFNTEPKKVFDVLLDNGIKISSEDIITPSLDVLVEQDDSVISVTRVMSTTNKKTEPLNFSTRIVEDETMLKGDSIVKSEGEMGVTEVTEKIIFHNGIEFDRVETATITKEAIDEVLVVGTKVVVSTSEESSISEIPFNVEYIYTDSLDKGIERVITQGVPGTSTKVFRITYENQVEVLREVILESVEDPINQVIEIGTHEKITNDNDVGLSGIESDPDFDLICAIVAHEAGPNYESSLAVMSCVMNRIDAGIWGGNDPISVLTAPGQFASYLDGYYQQYMGASIPEVRQAVKDCYDNGTRSHGYTSFRSYQTTGSVNIGGNWYF